MGIASWMLGEVAIGAGSPASSNRKGVWWGGLVSLIKGMNFSLYKILLYYYSICVHKNCVHTNSQLGPRLSSQTFHDVEFGFMTQMSHCDFFRHGRKSGTFRWAFPIDGWILPKSFCHLWRVVSCTKLYFSVCSVWVSTQK